MYINVYGGFVGNDECLFRANINTDIRRKILMSFGGYNCSRSSIKANSYN